METLLAVIVMLLLLTALVPLVIKQVMRRRFLRSLAAGEVVYLTFDDGPAPESTPLVLERLDAAGARGTFFLVASKVREHPHLVADILKKGHEIGSHGFDHRHPWRVSPLSALRDLQAGCEELRSYGPPPSRFFRPPYGKFSLLSAVWSVSSGQRPAFWSLDPRDYAAPSAQDVVDSILSRVRGGSVILLHDGYQREGRDPALLADALELLLPELATRGFRCATLSDQGSSRDGH